MTRRERFEKRLIEARKPPSGKVIKGAFCNSAVKGVPVLRGLPKNAVNFKLRFDWNNPTIRTVTLLHASGKAREVILFLVEYPESGQFEVVPSDRVIKMNA